MSDGELIAAFQNGDQRAFEVLYERYHRRIVVFYWQRTRTPHAAEDYAHDVFVRALDHLDNFDRSRPMWPWLKTIARNRLIDHYRASNYRVDLPDDALPDVDNDFDARTTSMAEQQVLSQAIHRLPPRERAALTLKYCDDLNTSELQESFGIGRFAVYKLLQRARDQLRDAYEDLTDSKLAGFLPTPLVGRLRRIVERVRARSTGLDANLLAFTNGFEAFASAATAVAIGVGLATAAGTTNNPPDVRIDQEAIAASGSDVISSDFLAQDATVSTSLEDVDISERRTQTVDEPNPTTASRRSVTAKVPSPETGSESSATVDAAVESGTGEDENEGKTIELVSEVEGRTGDTGPVGDDNELVLYCEQTTAGRAMCDAYEAVDRQLTDLSP